MVEIIYSLRSLVFYFTRSEDSGVWETKPWMEFTLTVSWCCLFLGNLIILIGVCDLTVTEVFLKSYLSNHYDMLLVSTNTTAYARSDQHRKRILSTRTPHILPAIKPPYSAFYSRAITRPTIFFNPFRKQSKFTKLQKILLKKILGATITYLVIIVTFKD